MPKTVRATASAILASAFCALAPSVASAGTLDQQQTGTSGTPYGADSVLSVAQTFTAGIGGGLDRADLHLRTVGTPAAPLTVEIRDASGGTPGSTVLASASVPASAVSPSPGAYVPISFTPSAAVVAGTQYAIVAYSSAAAPNFYGWSTSFANLYAGGNGFFTSNSPPSGSWNSLQSFLDFTFTTYVAPTPAISGERAAALATCKRRAHKHHWSHKRLKGCKKDANRLPV
jgi:hypothetical protein